MTENNPNRFIIDVEETTQENAVFELGNFVCFADDTDSLVDRLNEISRELAIKTMNEYKLKRHHFTEMGGFSKHHDGDGKYSISSENVIPKYSPIIKIKSPNGIWNEIVTDLIYDILKGDKK